MPRFFFHIAYNGTNYRGWQKLPGIKSIQEEIESTLGKILHRRVEINGCGRTDAGVHASQYFFHTDLEENWEFDLKFRANMALPEDISLLDIIPVHDKAHARFDAYSRSYDYFIHGTKDPFLNPASSYYPLEGLDLELMARAVALLPNYDNFVAFCLTPEKHEHHICRVSDAKLYTNQSRDRLRFHLSSNRFLKGMIRILVRKLLEIGAGNLSLEDFEESLRSGLVLPETIKSHARGLYLSRVVYYNPELAALPVKSCVLNDNDWILLAPVLTA